MNPVLFETYSPDDIAGVLGDPETASSYCDGDFLVLPTAVLCLATLGTAVPRDFWLRLGGYAGWAVDVNHEKRFLSAGDSADFDALLDTLSPHEFAHLWMTRYEEDRFSVFVNAERGWCFYEAVPGRGGVAARDPEAAGAFEVVEHFACVCGVDLAFPRTATLPRARALEIAAAYFAIGILPDSVPWARSGGVC